eukprot:SRR837773.24565.p2 GENE.SRR837773.24565~~SRR837773.24565.p2  ORF type:complete len:179 (+),score=19.26 SRR837773.24565:54-539(+)
MIESAFPKHFRMLSAYFSTAATTRPPTACKRMTHHTMPRYPCVKPASRIAAPSCMKHPISAKTAPMDPSWIFLSQMDASVCFNIFSRYTPASPEVTQALKTAVKPTTGLPSALAAGAASPLGNCIKVTPAVNTNSDAHFVGPRALPRMMTLSTAVVNILSW